MRRMWFIIFSSHSSAQFRLKDFTVQTDTHVSGPPFHWFFFSFSSPTQTLAPSSRRNILSAHISDRFRFCSGAVVNLCDYKPFSWSIACYYQSLIANFPHFHSSMWWMLSPFPLKMMNRLWRLVFRRSRWHRSSPSNPAAAAYLQTLRERKKVDKRRGDGRKKAILNVINNQWGRRR